MNSIIFITKDALRCGALPVYGNNYWKTPNIDELADKGTVFKRHYTAGASTAMAFTSMALGKYCYETDRKLYDGSESGSNGDTLFDLLYEKGYDVHIAWDNSYSTFAKTHEYLKSLYGDYMTPSLPEKRVAHHYTKVIDLNNSYIKYM